MTFDKPIKVGLRDGARIAWFVRLEEQQDDTIVARLVFHDSDVVQRIPIRDFVQHWRAVGE